MKQNLHVIWAIAKAFKHNIILIISTNIAIKGYQSQGNTQSIIV